MGVGAEKMALLRRHRSAFAVGDAFVQTQCSGFAAQGQGGGVGTGDEPRVKQIEVGLVLHDVFFIGQTCHGVFCGEAGDVIRRLHGALDGGV